ncbi:MAG: hypothetical protein DBX97_23235 [Collinsella tanakaei]|nr:MAG: hypothetical protein DBX97_23235 [Collinsella tanakaei]
MLITKTLIFQSIFFTVRFSYFNSSFCSFTLTSSKFQLFSFFIRNSHFYQTIITFTCIFKPSLKQFFIASFSRR